MTLTLPSRYYDSVTLMQAAKALTEMDDIADAAAVMATPANLEFLSSAGLLAPEIEGARPDDLVIALSAQTEAAGRAALARVGELLEARTTASRRPEGARARSLSAAIAAHPDANLAVISVAGRYSAREARTALESGLSVLLFSDNVPVEDEVALKDLAGQKRLLCMGPDAGTAIINGVALGFANAVPRGPVGLVGASGTGLQGIACALARQGVGVSQAIGVGGRDLTDIVGGRMMLAALDALEADPSTSVIVLVSKPPAPAVAARVLERSGASGKPVVACFLGMAPSIIEDAGVRPARELTEAATAAAALARGLDPEHLIEGPTPAEVAVFAQADAERARLASGQWALRGLYSGGTFCYEAQLLLQRLEPPVLSNAPIEIRRRLPNANRSVGHTIIDLGEDEFTQGRLHPMLDPALRNRRIVQEAREPETAVILLDFVLGYGAHPDPAGAAVAAVGEARDAALASGRYIAFVASVCGTEQDPQVLSAQEALLREAGLIVAPDNATAVRLAHRIVESRRG
jgi:succinyl-CoA synthetase alpha subunit